jgi:hypothetical protein
MLCACAWPLYCAEHDLVHSRDSTSIVSDTISSDAKVDSNAKTVRVTFDIGRIAAMVGYEIINGRYGDLFCWDMGCEYRVAPMLTCGIGVLLVSNTTYSYATIVNGFTFSEVLSSMSTFEYARTRVSLDWYMSGEAYTDSFVLGLDGSYRSFTSSSYPKAPPFCIGTTLGYRWFSPSGFTSEATFGVDTYTGIDPSRQVSWRYMIGYVF